MKQQAFQQRPGIIFYCSNGYILREIFQPLIEQLFMQYRIYLWVADFYVSAANRELIKQWQEQGKIEEGFVFNPYQEKESALVYHRRVLLLINSYDGKGINGVVADNEQYVFNKYLLGWARQRQAKIIILQTGTLWRLLGEFRRRLGKIDTVPVILQDVVKGEKEEKGALWSRALSKIFRVIKARWFEINNYYLCPWIVNGRVLGVTSYDRYVFVTKPVNMTLCYQPQEAQAITTLIPDIGLVKVVDFPCTESCRCGGNKGSSRKLMVVFGGNLAHELKGVRFDRWVDVIGQVIVEGHIDEVHVRVHPRTNSVLEWPKRLLEAIAIKDVTVQLMRTMDVSLLDIVCDYVGFLGSPSGSLRIARVVCPHVFVLGMAQYGDGSPDDQEWILGGTPGIVWVGEKTVHAEELELKPLDEKRMTVGEMIRSCI